MKKIWLEDYWKPVDKRVNGFQPEMIEVSISVILFQNEWTMFHGNRICKVENNVYETIDTFDEFTLLLGNIVWNKYFNIDMPYSEKFEEYGAIRPVFEKYPSELVEALSILKIEYSENVTKFIKSKEKFEIACDDYFHMKNKYKYSIEKDNFPNCEEITPMILFFESKEKAMDFLNKLKQLLN